MSLPADRATRIASRTRGAGTRHVSASFTIALKSQTPKSAARLRTPNASHARTPALSSRRKTPSRPNSSKPQQKTPGLPDSVLISSPKKKAPDSQSRSGRQSQRLPESAIQNNRAKPKLLSARVSVPMQAPSPALSRSEVNSTAMPEVPRPVTPLFYSEPESDDRVESEEESREAKLSGKTASMGQDSDVPREVSPSNLDPELFDDDSDRDRDDDYEDLELPKRKANAVAREPRPKKRKTHKKARKTAETEEDEEQLVHITTYKLPPSIGGKGAPALSEVDVVSQVLAEQLAASVKSHDKPFQHRVLKAFSEEIQIQLARLRDAVDSQGVLRRAVRKAKRTITEQQERLLQLRRERQSVAEQFAAVRQSHKAGQHEARQEAAVRDVLAGVSGVRARAVGIVPEEGQPERRVGVVAELQRIVPLLCGEGAVLGRLRELNDMLEQAEEQLIVS